MPKIRRMLDLSTGHLPEPIFRAIEAQAKSDDDRAMGGVYPYEYGLILWVPSDPDDSSNFGHDLDSAPEVLAVRRYARSLGCDFVMFDESAEQDDALPLWKW